MRTGKQSVLIATFLLMMVAGAASVFGQERPPAPPPPPKGDGDNVFFERHVGPPPPGGEPRIDILPSGKGPGDTFVFVSTEMSFGSKIVRNAPYSAQATTETVQVLGDGNRIVRKNTASIYRDSEGRTRHDQTLNSIGPWAAAGQSQQTSFISDPVNRVHYVLEPRSRIARKLPLPPMPPPPPQRSGANNSADVKPDVKVRVMALPGGARDKVSVITGGDADNDVDVVIAADAGRMLRERKPDGKVRQESLGKQTIEGVEAEGTRETFTIAAGEIGNEQAIQVVSERWYSPELQTVVLSRHSDPRFGETTFRLTDINRSEPARALFEVPADYTIKEGPDVQRIFRRRPNEEK